MIVHRCFQAIRGIQVIVFLTAAASSMACAGSPAAATPPPADPYPDGPRIACPAPPPPVTSPSGQSTIVVYGSATATGGAPPLSVSCTPASQTSFPIGTTTVACTVTDARQRTAACSFPVTVTMAPRIGKTSFLAFGDSMTAGEIPSEGFGGARILRIDVAKSYPTVLGVALTTRYVAQSITVANAGEPGRKAVQLPPDLTSFLSSGRYQVLLLMAGANDLSGGDPSQIPAATTAMDFMVRDATSRGVEVFVATLPPQNPLGSAGHGGAFLVVRYNSAIATMAAADGVTLVDVFTAFGGDVTTLIDIDGLHPTAMGYEVIARTFFDAIKRKLEIAAGSTIAPFTTSPSGPSGPSVARPAKVPPVAGRR